MNNSNIDNCLSYMLQFNIPITGRNFLNEYKKYLSNDDKIAISRIYSYIQTNKKELLLIGCSDNYLFERAKNIVDYYNNIIKKLDVYHNEEDRLSLKIDILDKYFK